MDEKLLEKMREIFEKGTQVTVIGTAENNVDLPLGIKGIVTGVSADGVLQVEFKDFGRRELSAECGDEVERIGRLLEKDCYSFEYDLQKSGIELSILDRKTKEKVKTRVDDDSLILDIGKSLDEGTPEQDNTDFLEQEAKAHIKAAIYKDLLSARYTWPDSDKGTLELNVNEFADELYSKHFASKIKDFKNNLQLAQQRSVSRNKDVRPAIKAPGKIYKGIVRECNGKSFVTEQGGLTVKHNFKDLSEDSWKNIYNGRAVKVVYRRRAHMLDKAGRALAWQLGVEMDTGRELLKH